MGSLSGDLTQTGRGPDGQIYVLLADFTGHGLPAALGALPASSVFLAMAHKGLSVEGIAAELNRKLYQLLPIGYFCCAVVVELAAEAGVALTPAGATYPNGDDPNNSNIRLAPSRPPLPRRATTRSARDGRPIHRAWPLLAWRPDGRQARTCVTI